MSHVTCLMSGVICQVPGVSCHMSGVKYHMYFFIYKVVELVGGGSAINSAYHVTFLVVLKRLCVLVYMPAVLY